MHVLHIPAPRPTPQPAPSGSLLGGPSLRHGGPHTERLRRCLYQWGPPRAGGGRATFGPGTDSDCEAGPAPTATHQLETPESRRGHQLSPAAGEQDGERALPRLRPVQAPGRRVAPPPLEWSSHPVSRFASSGKALTDSARHTFCRRRGLWPHEVSHRGGRAEPACVLPQPLCTPRPRPAPGEDGVLALASLLCPGSDGACWTPDTRPLLQAPSSAAGAEAEFVRDVAAGGCGLLAASSSWPVLRAAAGLGTVRVGRLGHSLGQASEASPPAPQAPASCRDLAVARRALA